MIKIWCKVEKRLSTQSNYNCEAWNCPNIDIGKIGIIGKIGVGKIGKMSFEFLNFFLQFKGNAKVL